MAKFKYSALDKNKKMVYGVIEGDSPRDVRASLREQELLTASLEEISEVVLNQSSDVITSDENNFAENKLLINRLSLDEKIIFCSQLEVMTSSQVSPLDALEVISKHSPKHKVASLASDMENRIRKGASLAQTIQLYSNVFGGVCYALCLAGENSGTLPENLNRLVSIYKKQDNLKKKIIQASIYPLVIILGVIGVFLFFGLIVFPVMINKMGMSVNEASGLMQFIVNFSNFLVKNFVINTLCLVGLIFGLKQLFKLQKVKDFLDGILHNFILTSVLYNLMNLSNLISILGYGYQAGLTLPKAIELGKNSIFSSIMKKKVDKIEQFLLKGEALSDACLKTDLITDMDYITIMVTGEKAGRLGDTLIDISDKIDEKIDNVIGIIVSIFPTVLMIIVGIMVAILVFILISAINSLYSGIF